MALDTQTHAPPLEPWRSHRLVFLGGLHRSGTTPLARWLASHPEVSAFRNTGAPEDEGMHLQDVYPPTSRYGGPGRFAFKRAAHLTEASPLVSNESRRRLWRAWARHWDLTRPVLLEKSPPNLIWGRFLQALFPGSRFIVITRHPIAVAYATKKWSHTSLLSLLRHWVLAHRIFLGDAPALRRVALVRYEDLVASPRREVSRIQSFVGLEPRAGSWEVRRGLNTGYYHRWTGDDARLPGLLGEFERGYVALLARAFESHVRPFGYSLREPWVVDSVAPAVARHFIDGSSTMDHPSAAVATLETV
jgi:hypothetical protein